MQFHNNPTGRNGLCYEYTRDQISAINAGESISNFDPVRVTRKTLDSRTVVKNFIADLELKYLLED